MNSDKHILLFDGVCNTCNFVVDCLLKLDKKRVLSFASLQSEVGHVLLNKFHLPMDKMETLVLISNNKTFTHSSAVFEILRIIGWPWKFFTIFSFLPRPLTDFLYKLYSRNRYRLFGKSETCRLLTPEEKGRFIEDVRDL